MKARDLMSTQLYVATMDDPVSVAAALMRDKEVGIIWSTTGLRAPSTRLPGSSRRD
ncbi:MAG: hypothetical protein ACSLFE_07905 [Gemmatimonadaceae bacterium]